jgi:hypothetical protein
MDSESTHIANAELESLITGTPADTIDFDSLDIDAIVADRKKFDEFVYTPVLDAVRQLRERAENRSIRISHDLPKIFDRKYNLVLARHVATPNFEMLRFMAAVDALEMEPILLEYLDDMLALENKSKYFLCKLTFFEGFGKHGGLKTTKIPVVDFNAASGKSISSISTGQQSLVEMHHEFFRQAFGRFADNVCDISPWYKENGGCASQYYDFFLSLFVKNGILFENFLLAKAEINFTRDIFLTAFIRVWQRTGYKPLIVALEPTTIEGDEFLYYYPREYMNLFKKVYNEKHS